MRSASFKTLIAVCAVAAWVPVTAGTASQDLTAVARAAEVHARKVAKKMQYKDIEARARALDARLALSPCGHALETFAAPGRGAGRTTVGVRCNAPQPWTLYVPVQVDASVQTVVLRDTMPRGSILAASDMRVELKPADSVYGQLLTSLASAAGKQLRRDMRAGTALRLNMLVDPQSVARGQTTQILSVVNNIEVVMNGTALNGGSAGDVIKIRNNTSGRLLEGVVMMDGRVRVP